MSDRPATYYFPSDWDLIHGVHLWLSERSVDWGKMRIEFDGQYSAELRGSEQHERTTDFYG